MAPRPPSAAVGPPASRGDGARPRRGRSACLLLLAVGLLPGCGGQESAGEAVAIDPRARLSQLLRRGAQPGELTHAERGEVESLLQPLLPATAGKLAGYRWRVTYDDLPAGDFVSLDLIEGEGDAAPRAMWFHLLWRGEATPAERAGYVDTLGSWPARGVDDHHLFVRAGTVELRAVADRDDYRDAGRIRGVVEAFDLEALSRL